MNKVRRLKKGAFSLLESVSISITDWIGTPISIIIHSLIFIGIFSLKIFGVSIDSILLILTTAVSLEAIYLAILIQMTVNRQNTSIAAVEEDVGDIAEDVEDLAEDVEDLSEGAQDDDKVDTEVTEVLKSIEGKLGKIQIDLEVLKKKGLL